MAGQRDLVSAAQSVLLVTPEPHEMATGDNRLRRLVNQDDLTRLALRQQVISVGPEDHLGKLCFITEADDPSRVIPAMVLDAIGRRGEVFHRRNGGQTRADAVVTATAAPPDRIA